ncbi:MAG: permease [Alcanivoracaceae bacterium]
MQDFLALWQEAARTSVGFFWMAFWAFMLGYLISSLIQVLVTQERMQAAMGRDGPKSMALGTFFGFLSSSCSFSALSTTRSLFAKGAGLAPSVAFLLASTNLVIELGIVISIFLGWQFVVGEYVGGLVLILISWLLIRITRPRRLEQMARKKLSEGSGHEHTSGVSWWQKVRSLAGWSQIGKTYLMEWQMVWKDVLIGFTVAGVIAAFVPREFFEALFPGAGSAAGTGPSFADVVAQAIAGPLAAFFTFIGSMGNIPLAAVLFGQGVSFAGVMAFIFSDLVVFPVLRINASYYGWPMALYLLVLMLVGIVVTAVALHYALAFAGWLPDVSQASAPAAREFFKVNYQMILNMVFMTASAGLLVVSRMGHAGHHHHHDHDHASSLTDTVLRVLALVAMLWLGGGLLLSFR